MKVKQLLLAATVLAASFTSCSDDNEHSYKGGDSPVLFSSTIGGSVEAKAAGDTWGSGDAIGVYMKKGAGLGTIVEAGANKKYTTPATGNFSPATTADALFFPKDNSNVDFIAYYPHSTTLVSNIYKVDVATQTSQEAIDLLYSDNATALNGTSASVSLNFTHQLSKVVFNIKAGSGIASLSSLSVKLASTKTKADFDLATKTLSGETAVADITFKTTAAATTATAEAIVLPATGIAGRVVTFVLPEGNFEWPVPATIAFEAGKKNSFEVELKKGGGTSVYPTATITDWGAGSSENIVIDLGEGSGGTNDGSQASPFTIAEAAAKVGETGKWVTGYIVGSTTTPKAIGAMSTNILIADTKGETDESKCIPVNLDGSSVAEYLDITAATDLVGVKVKVQGNIVNDIFGNVLAMTSITAQEGGKKGGGVTPVEPPYFNENFGLDETKYTSATRPKVATHTEWLMKAPIAYSDPSAFIDIRTTTTINPSAWLPATKSSALVIEGIPAHTGNTLSYDIAVGSGTGNTEANILKVLCNGTAVSIPSTILVKTNEYTTITVAIPDNTTKIEFKLDASSAEGYRLDNVKIKGSK